MLQHLKRKINEELETLNKDDIKINRLTIQRNLESWLIKDMQTKEDKKIIIEIEYTEQKDHRNFWKENKKWN